MLMIMGSVSKMRLFSNLIYRASCQVAHVVVLRKTQLSNPQHELLDPHVNIFKELVMHPLVDSHAITL